MEATGMLHKRQSLTLSTPLSTDCSSTGRCPSVTWCCHGHSGAKSLLYGCSTQYSMAKSILLLLGCTSRHPNANLLHIGEFRVHFEKITVDG